ncbi:MAG: chromate efflux transporter [Gemmatimonadetes bacterium]|nr:chromate efflux transporter [Gemmatimonadota bacterium]MYH19847.1 chromate efflux transporter [Gemmatimonadota bacterium]MYK99572.1 chromate efflux transporter [Gemmatimonadota bacterium]
MWELFWRFLALGCISFGGPVAHLGYFRTAFVDRLKWLDEAAYGRLVALSQFLPGPSSSQVGFAIGYQRAGVAGGVAVFLGFTLPSFVLLYLLAIAGSTVTDTVWFGGFVKGLKLLAVVVVADAVLGMYATFCRRRLTGALCILTASALLVAPSMATQFAVLAVGALAGWRFLRAPEASPGGRLHFSWLPLTLFFLLLIGLPLLASLSPDLDLLSRFYQAGSLVFGGGHVVLPLLQQTVGDALPIDRFLLGYAAAQAIPGPMFAMSAFLGAGMNPDHALAGALIAVLGIFLPGFLLILSFHDTWETLARKPGAAGAVAGVNASVVGLLLAALYQPVFVNAVFSPLDLALAIIGFFLLRVLRLPILALVAFFAAAGMLQAVLG